jgi:hypothetical protein
MWSSFSSKFRLHSEVRENRILITSRMHVSEQTYSYSKEKICYAQETSRYHSWTSCLRSCGGPVYRQHQYQEERLVANVLLNQTSLTYYLSNSSVEYDLYWKVKGDQVVKIIYIYINRPIHYYNRKILSLDHRELNVVRSVIGCVTTDPL